MSKPSRLNLPAIDHLLYVIRLRLARNPRSRARLFSYRGVRMGSGCSVFSGVSFGSEPYLIRLGDNVKVTSGVHFVTHDGGMHVLRQEDAYAQADLFGEISVGNNVFIGINSIILPGVKIGDNVVIGAGSTVTVDIPSDSVAAGVTCRVIKSLESYRDAVRPRITMTKGWDSTRKQEFLVEKFGVEEQ